MLSLSTALRSLLIGPNALTDILAHGRIRIFSGAQPSNADQAEQGTLLAIVTLNGLPATPGLPTNGLQLTQNGVFVLKPQGDPWLFTAIATGTAGWFRYCGNAPDAGVASTTLPRIDGAIATASPSEMVWQSTSLVAGTTYSIDNFSYALGLN